MYTWNARRRGSEWADHTGVTHNDMFISCEHGKDYLITHPGLCKDRWWNSVKVTSARPTPLLPWPKALKETICCWSGEPCSVIILLEPVKRPSLWGLIWSCQEGVTSLCGLPCDHKGVNGSNLLATRTLNDRQQHESLHYPQGISLICQEPECFCLSLLTIFRKPLFTCLIYCH